jgi:ADP-ribosylglycohydrolase
MAKAALKKQIYQYVDLADEKTLRIVKAMLAEAIGDIVGKASTLSNEQLTLLKSRVDSFKERKSKEFSWEEVQALAREQE